MIEGLKSRLRSAARQLATLPWRALGGRLRTEALEDASTRAVTETDLPAGRLRFWTPTPLLLHRADSVLTKEPDMIPWLDGIPPDAVLWDIGANVGVFSLYAACFRQCKVLAFEPSAANFHALTRNIGLNDAADRIASYCIALSGATELGVLNMSSAAMGTAVSQFGKQGEMSRYWSGNGNAPSHGMVGFTVDEFVEQFRPPFPTHLKLDVDGLEWPILEGAAGLLRDPRLRSVMVELSLTNESERAQAIKLLELSGLLFVSSGPAQGSGTEQAANHLFERRNA
jgi:FkbM family methyltransferase